MRNILLMSGGNDSMYIYDKLNKKLKFELIYFDYGQPYFDTEILKVPMDTVIVSIEQLKIEPSGYVEGRNLMFLIEVAKMVGIEKVNLYMGSNKEDIFPDNNEKYLKNAIDIINTSFRTNIKIVLPLKDKTKKEIIKHIYDNNISTYSCYRGKKKVCGKCKACRSVIDASTHP